VVLVESQLRPKSAFNLGFIHVEILATIDGVVYETRVGQVIAGPAQIQMVGTIHNCDDGDHSDFPTLHLPAVAYLGQFYLYNTQTASTISVNAKNYVVIPESVSGSVQVILESSADMVDWVATNPGVYSADNTKRFFRVRAVAE